MNPRDILRTERLLGALLIALFVALVFSGRPLFPTSMPKVREIATLPDSDKLQPVRAYAEYGAVQLPYNEREKMDRAPPSWDAPRPVRIGFSFRELSFVRLPFWAKSEFGMVAFVDTPGGYRMTPMGPQQVKLLGELTGRDWSGTSLEPWRFAWGWLFVLGFVAIGLLHLRRQAKWREENGII
jgi:hypothetical protein